MGYAIPSVLRSGSAKIPIRYVKSVQISCFFSGPYFPIFRVNSFFSPNIGKYRPEKTLCLDTFTLILI